MPIDRFVGEGMAMGRIPGLTGGGLIRSKGGWSQVLSSRRRGQVEEYDERILGAEISSTPFSRRPRIRPEGS